MQIPLPEFHDLHRDGRDVDKAGEAEMIGYPEIEQQWLLGNATSMSAKQWETAFRWCAEKFGREWLQPTRPGKLVADAYVVAAVWDAGSRAESLRGADMLIRKLGTSISDVDWSVLAE